MWWYKICRMISQIWHSILDCISICITVSNHVLWTRLIRIVLYAAWKRIFFRSILMNSFNCFMHQMLWSQWGSPSLFLPPWYFSPTTLQLQGSVHNRASVLSSTQPCTCQEMCRTGYNTRDLCAFFYNGFGCVFHTFCQQVAHQIVQDSL